MMLLAAAVLGLAMGAVLGALGGGGAILTVPILVYVLGQSAQEATTSSLVIVGVTAVIGALGHTRAGNVRWGVGAAFGAAGIPAAYVGTQANRHVDEHLLLLGFAVVMVLAAAGMLTRRDAGGPEPAAQSRSSDASKAAGPPSPEASAAQRDNEELLGPGGTATRVLARPRAEAQPRGGAATLAKIVAAGLVVGFLTGFFGVGGGFVIVPALVLALRFLMPAAVATSLLIIAINSAASLAARADHADFDWALILPFTAAAVVGTFGGYRVAERISGRTLTRAFAVLLLLVGAYVGLHSAVSLL